MDGYGILHELYDVHSLDWANGGRYAEQHRVTVDYFEALIRAGVKPIVVVDGGGCAVQNNDYVYRRSRNIVDIPQCLEKHHKGQKASHTMPIMAREVFVSSLREKNIDVYVADGKAAKTVVYLANYYQCPVLTNNTNYCVLGVVGGVVFFKHLDITSDICVFEQTKLVEFCKLRNPDLVYAILAILGDGSDVSVPFLYHGRIRAQIQDCIKGCDMHGRSWVLNVADFLRIKGIASFDEFKHKLKSFDFGRQCEKLLNNCHQVEENYIHTYYTTATTLKVDELKESTTIKCSKPCDLPVHILQKYRSGTFPVLIIDAMTLGQCLLEQLVGDQEQPPYSMLGLPVRQLMYGLASSLMKQDGRVAIIAVLMVF